MQELAPAQAQLGIGRNPQLVVAEVITVAALLAHNAPAPQLVQRLDQRPWGQPAGALHDFQAELAADHGCGLGQAARSGRELCQPLRQHCLHAGWRANAPRAECTMLAMRVWIGVRLRFDRRQQVAAHRLHQEQGIALAVIVEVAGLAGGQAAPGQAGGQRHGLVEAQRPQRQLMPLSAALQVQTQRRQRMACLHLLGVGGAQHQQPRCTRPAQQVAQPVQRLSVAAVQVVAPQQQRPARRQQRRRQGLEEALALPGLGQRTGIARRGLLAQHLRDKAGNLGPALRVERGQPGLDRGTAQPIGDDRVGQAMAGGMTAGNGHVASLPPHPGGQLLGQARGADARLAAQQRQATVTCRRRLPNLQQACPLLLTAHQGRHSRRSDRCGGDSADYCAGRPSLQQALINRLGSRAGIDPQFLA